MASPSRPTTPVRKSDFPKYGYAPGPRPVAQRRVRLRWEPTSKGGDDAAGPGQDRCRSLRLDVGRTRATEGSRRRRERRQPPSNCATGYPTGGCSTGPVTGLSPTQRRINPGDQTATLEPADLTGSADYSRSHRSNVFRRVHTKYGAKSCEDGGPRGFMERLRLLPRLLSPGRGRWSGRSCRQRTAPTRRRTRSWPRSSAGCGTRTYSAIGRADTRRRTAV